MGKAESELPESYRVPTVVPKAAPENHQIGLRKKFDDSSHEEVPAARASELAMGTVKQPLEFQTNTDPFGLLLDTSSQERINGAVLESSYDTGESLNLNYLDRMRRPRLIRTTDATDCAP
jgi:hypothetical protein